MLFRSRIREGVRYDIIGMITEVKEYTTKAGDKMGHVVLEDYNGRLDVTVFAKQWALCSAAMTIGKVIGVQGVFKTFNDKLSFSALNVYGDPNQMKPTKIKRVYIEINQSEGNRAAIREIRAVSQKHRGTAELAFVVYPNVNDEGQLEGKPTKVVSDERFNVNASKELFKALKECPSVYDVFAE